MRGSRRAASLAVGAVLAAIVGTPPAGASRPGDSGPPRYPSYPYTLRNGSGDGASLAFKQCVGTVLPEGCGTTANEHRWVWKVDEKTYGASGFVTFYDYRNPIEALNGANAPGNANPEVGDGAMQGPGGTGTNDFQVLPPDDYDPVVTPEWLGDLRGRLAAKQPLYDFERPAFTQDVDVVDPDFDTPDNRVVDADLNPISTTGYDIQSDFNPALYHPDEVPADGVGASVFGDHPDASPDGSANLYKFAFTVAPGTQFMNMQVDKLGNYFVARRDMQWDWIDSFQYRKVGESTTTTVDTQFNIAPYPISNAYGWCGAIPVDDPNTLTPMAGQLVKDIAFDVYAVDGSPALGEPPFTTEVVPNFVMRSYGLYVIDVTMHSFGGVRQRFSSAAKGVHYRTDGSTPTGTYNPTTGKRTGTPPDYQRWHNTVSPFAAGVVPAGAWVINEGSRENMQVVPAGTPGAVWHQNRFAGAAFLVRGDMERRVNFVQADSGWAGDQSTVADDTELYRKLIDAGEMDRSDWTHWNVGGTGILPDAH